MDKTDMLVLSVIFSVCGIVGVAAGIGYIFSEGPGWLTGGILCFIMIPVIIEFNNNFDK